MSYNLSKHPHKVDRTVQSNEAKSCAGAEALNDNFTVKRAPQGLEIKSFFTGNLSTAN